MHQMAHECRQMSLRKCWPLVLEETGLRACEELSAPSLQYNYFENIFENIKYSQKKVYNTTHSC